MSPLLPDDDGSPPAVSVHAPPVLHLDTPHVELSWSRRGEVQYAALVVEGRGNEPLVAAARQLVSEARLGRQGVVLCLASPFFDSRQVLLGRVPEAEARAVLARKAANSLGTDLDETLFWARRCETPLAEVESAQATWLVHTRRRSEHFDLLLRLRRARIRVRRTVAGRDVLTRMLDDAEGTAGSILVTTTGRAVYAHLFRGRELVQESRLPLDDFDLRHETYAGIVQDVRQLAAFWSKGSRGTPLKAVHLFGFAAADVEGMRTPLEIAAQGAEVRALSVPPSDSFASLRAGVLDGFRRHALRAPDLSIPLPLRATRVAAVTFLVSCVAGFGAWRLFDHWSLRVDQRSAQIREELLGTEDIERDMELRASYESARASLLTSIASLEAMARRGVPLDATLHHVNGTIGRVVDVRHLSIDETDSGTRVLLEASLPDEVRSAALQLERLRQAMQRDARFSEVVIEPSSHVPDRTRGERLTFTLTGLFLGRDA